MKHMPHRVPIHSNYTVIAIVSMIRDTNIVLVHHDEDFVAPAQHIRQLQHIEIEP